MGARLVKRSLSSSFVLAGCIHRSLSGLKHGRRVITGLGAHNALLGKRNGAGCVSLLVIVVRLGLDQRGLRGLDLGFGIHGGAADLSNSLALGLNGLSQLETRSEEHTSE